MKNKKYLSLILCFLMVILVSMHEINASAKDKDADAKDNKYIDGFYEYPITIMSDDWFNYSVKEKVAMLIIDQETLNRMTDRQLVYAIADYPYLVDIYLYNSFEEGLTNFKKNCSAYCELMERLSGIESLKTYSEEIIESYKITPRLDGQTDFVANALNDIIEYYDEDNLRPSSGTRATVMTPNHTSVYVTTPSETHTTNYHTSLDNSVVSTYGVTKVRTGSCKYNCHSYAWYSISSNNPYWMPDPTAYTTDGSYTKKFTGTPSSSINTSGISVNDRVYYANKTHTAFFIDNPSSGAPLGTLLVKSKWGQAGVFEHAVSNVPAGYDDSTLTIWHR